MTRCEIMYITWNGFTPIARADISVGYYHLRQPRDCYDWFMTYLISPRRRSVQREFMGVDVTISSMRISR